MGQKVSPIGLRLGITKKHQSQWFVDPRNGSMKKSYPALILEDKFIREFITPKFPNTSIAHILIFRTLDYIWVEIHTAPNQNLSLLSSRRVKNNKENPDWKDQDKTKFKNSSSNTGLSELNVKSLQEELQLALGKYKKKTLALLFFNPRNTFDTAGNKLESLNLSHKSTVNLGILIKQLNRPFQYASVLAKSLASQLEKRENTFKNVLTNSLRLIENYTTIKGIKIKVAGRLNGADIAEHKSFFKGRIPLSTIDAKIDYCQETSKTLYGILGVKVWIWHQDD